MKRTMIILAAATILFSFALSSCAPKEKPEDTVSSFLNAAQSFDLEKMSALVQNGQSLSSIKSQDEDWFKYFKDAGSKITFSISGSTVDRDTATVSAACRFVDSSVLMQNVIGEFYMQSLDLASKGTTLTEAEANELMSKIMEEQLSLTEEVFIEHTIKIECVKSNDVWLIKEINDELGNVVTANFISAIKGMNDQLTNMANQIGQAAQSAGSGQSAESGK